MKLGVNFAMNFRGGFMARNLPENRPVKLVDQNTFWFRNPDDPNFPMISHNVFERGSGVNFFRQK